MITSDTLFSIGLLFNESYDSFVTDSLPFEPDASVRAWFTSVVTKVTYWHDPNLYEYTRTTYSTLDYLRDIGGLFGAINAIFTAIVFVLNFNGIQHWLTTLLFRVETLQDYMNLNRYRSTRVSNDMTRNIARSLAAKVSGSL